ncbi:unnamed protein product [Haemonchus placei]|uniref:SUN domain-containing protein n=1 Tax=Haemonchus placei TaxID=6290 RepID=A0A0N4WHV9_HAEPC|nr:unnamed protein product [Haemonchus placei]
MLATGRDTTWKPMRSNESGPVNVTSNLPPHSNRSSSETIDSKGLFRYVSLWLSRWLWFLTPTNIVGLGVILFIAAVFKHALPQDMLPKSGLVRYETALDTAHLMEMRLERFERQQFMQQASSLLPQAYLGKLQRIEQTMRNSIEQVRTEVRYSISELRSVMDKYKIEKEELAHADSRKLASQISSHLRTLEGQLNNRLAEVEAQITVASEGIRAATNTCSATSSSRAVEYSVEKKRGAVNLASRSHGAFVVPHLTSKAVSSDSALYNFFGTLFGLETYNFAITERTHIMPSEAFCFEGSEGKITIRLWSNASVDAVVYEHDYWHDIVPISAPDRYDVLPKLKFLRIFQIQQACMDRECENVSLLAECRYPVNEKDGPSQICEVQNRSSPTDQVQVIFRTNHGQKYTCVYQLKVLTWD